MRAAAKVRTPSGIVAIGRQAALFTADFARFGGRRAVFAAALVGMGAVLEGVGVVLLVPLLAILVSPAGTSGWIGRASQWILGALPGESTFARLVALLTVFALLMGIRTIVLVLRDVTLARLQFGFVEAQRMGMTRRLAATNWETVSRLSHARIAHLMSADIQRTGVAAQFVLQCGVAVVMLVVQTAIAFLLSPLMAAFSLVLLLLSALILGPVLLRASAMGALTTTGNFMLTRDMAQFLGGLKQAFSHNREAAFVSKIEQTLTDMSEASIQFTRQRTAARMAITGIAALGAGVVLLVGYGVLGLPAPVLMAVLVVLGRTSGPATQIQQGLLQLVNALPAYGGVKALQAELDAAARPAGASLTAAAPALDGPVAFEAVSFQHGGERTDSEAAGQGVRDLDLVLQPGTFVGISGPSGAGKTTFADLLSGLYAPQSGRITVGGQPLVGGVARAWRNHIAYVTQDPFLFHDSVRNNMLWIAPGADEPAMWRALAITGADSLVRRMTQGLDTVLGDRGTLISGGERQRIALAGAILRRPGLFLLDEATSAIDVKAEQAILDRLRAAYPAALIVIIAHRAESLGRCDRVLTFEHGRLDDAAAGTARP